MAEYAKVGFASVGGLYNDWMSIKSFEELTEDQLAAIASIKTISKKFTHDDGTVEEIEGYEIKMHDKLKGLTQAEKLLGYNNPIKLEIDDKAGAIKKLPDAELDNRLERLAKERTLNIQSE